MYHLLVIDNTVLNNESSGGSGDKLTSNGGLEQGRKRWKCAREFFFEKTGVHVNTRLFELTRSFPNMPRALMDEHGEIRLFREETLGP
jgi:hypothetical protein